MNPNSPTDRPPWTLPLFWAIALSLLFAGLYGVTNWYTSTRTNVWVVRFAWEDYIPLVPAFIFPYMSIDLLFFFGPFLCTTRRELSTHASRIIVVSRSRSALVNRRHSRTCPMIDRGGSRSRRSCTRESMP